jgi:hypothetical protein
MVITKAELRTSVLAALSDPNATKWTNAQIDAFVLQAARKLVPQIEKSENGYLSSFTTFALSSTDTFVSLPTGCRKIDYLGIDGSKTQVGIIPQSKRNSYYPLPGGTGISFFLRQDTLILTDTLNDTVTFQMEFTEDISALAADDDTWSQLPTDAAEFIVWQAAVYALTANKESQEQVNQAQDLTNRALSNLNLSMEPRHRGHPEYVTDLEADYADDYFL